MDGEAGRGRKACSDDPRSRCDSDSEELPESTLARAPFIAAGDFSSLLPLSVPMAALASAGPATARGFLAGMGVGCSSGVSSHESNSMENLVQAEDSDSSSRALSPSCQTATEVLSKLVCTSLNSTASSRGHSSQSVHSSPSCHSIRGAASRFQAPRQSALPHTRSV